MYTEDKTLLSFVHRFAPDPGFQKKSVAIKSAELVELTGMEWSGGYKTDYVAIHLLEGRYASIHEGRQAKLSPGTAIIAYQWAGNNKYVTVFLHRENLASYLSVEDMRLTDRHLAILYCTRNYRNTYGGQTDLRRREAARAGYFFTPEQWRDEQSKLTKWGFLDRRGSLTTKGRNVAPERL